MKIKGMANCFIAKTGSLQKRETGQLMNLRKWSGR